VCSLVGVSVSGERCVCSLVGASVVVVVGVFTGVFTGRSVSSGCAGVVTGRNGCVHW
jgi:hypothetical protein